ncbi:NAD-dependent formate dehydrogenase delta subunit (fdsD) [Granulibacter bethesdensis]|uniref:NAD-dependent formate dehydrogenase delta subunit (FdsD) n=1 Tax=Granulibacter bethesdensis (strain ATCC BAA-1260 / CGDNIH1) TaxID=391165 RepID=Q0BQR8_GRABC|nr:NAD-dependent formate dehydrogenase delta subunit (fdsD) [Granulibacter bethesdensis CGDNIH1]AHJ68213.1 NAD-dependent formate dehydrogenase delta subunit (fdsD) [Granulibacter bethesdensis]APH52699.1 NAD-dependent formate dehydrogenase delta subunit (fdsD) [Granulibacter bethesdensis]APH65388.1 NAD-dependent formate dehydrogenase delta subunit (fdsD) [Granulibacter bethesdensis]
MPDLCLIASNHRKGNCPVTATNDRLVTMANQIAGFFSHRPEETAISGIAEHIVLYWEPRMRRAFDAIIESHNPALSPLAQKAGEYLMSHDVKPSDHDPLAGMQPRAVTGSDPKEDPNTPPGGFNTDEQHGDNRASS